MVRYVHGGLPALASHCTNDCYGNFFHPYHFTCGRDNTTFSCMLGDHQCLQVACVIQQSGHPPSLPDARYTNPCLGLLEMQDPMLEDVIQLAKVSQPGCKVVLMCVALCKQNTDRNERSMLASVMCFCQPCEIKACKLSAAVVLHCETKCGVSTSVLHMEIGRAVINTFEIALLFFFFLCSSENLYLPFTRVIFLHPKDVAEFNPGRKFFHGGK